MALRSSGTGKLLQSGTDEAKTLQQRLRLILFGKAQLIIFRRWRGGHRLRRCIQRRWCWGGRFHGETAVASLGPIGNIRPLGRNVRCRTRLRLRLRLRFVLFAHSDLPKGCVEGTPLYTFTFTGADENGSLVAASAVGLFAPAYTYSIKAIIPRISALPFTHLR